MNRIFDSSTMVSTLFLLFLLTTLAANLSNALSAAPKKVVVSGAGGQTGKALFRQLLGDDSFVPVGIVRTQTSKDALLEDSSLSIDDESRVIICDVTDETAVKGALDWNTVDALCICTSGTPGPTGEMKNDRPVFGFPEGGDPEIVDWIGQKSQIDAVSEATSSAVRHIVVCSSGGGTDPGNMLNSIGRKTDPETGEETGGNILLWKRKSEKYLIEKSGSDSNLKYTIVHPGGLINEPGNQRELIVGVDDDQINYGGEGSPRTVPRDDVARVMLEACRNLEAYGNRSFDLRAHLPAEGDDSCVTTDFSKLLESLDGKDCDYSLGKSM
jgi:nucleoside-diphosphate-sugar epimerase